MSETNLILEHLRAIRADIAILKHNDDEFRLRFSSIDAHLLAIHEDIFQQRFQQDRHETRILRIEHRLELID